MLIVKSFEDFQILFIKMCTDVVGLANLEAIYLFVYSSLSALLLQIWARTFIYIILFKSLQKP